MYSQRQENIQVKLELEAEAAKRHTLAVKLLLNRGIEEYNLHEGDTIKVDWGMVCGYMGDVAVQLEAVGSICDDPDVVVDAECSALIEGKVLVYEILHKLKKLIKKVQRRQEKELRRQEREKELRRQEKELFQSCVRTLLDY